MDLFKFLQERGIPEDTIKKMRDQKVDETVIPIIEDVMLEAYLPLFGDRVAVRNFCINKNKKQKSKTHGSSDLLKRLRAKLKTKKGGRDTGSDETSSEEDKPNQKKLKDDGSKKNALKTTRKIEIGWRNFEIDRYGGDLKYKQIRKPQGGGTRVIDVTKHEKASSVLNQAIDLYFVDGLSSKGFIDEFKCEIRDCRGELIKDDITIADMYNDSGVNLLRLYLYTKALDNPSKETSQTQVQVPEKKPPIESIFDGYDLGEDIEPSETNDNIFNGYSLADFDLLDEEFSFLESDTQTLPQPDTPTIQFNYKKELNIRLRRAVIMEDMINEFKNGQIISCKLNIKFVLPDGSEEQAVGKGVNQEAFTAFWEEFVKTTIGEDYKVPVIRHDYSKQEWNAVGRIVVKGWNEFNYFPICLAPPFMAEVIYGKDEPVDTNCFLSFVSHTEKRVIEDALSSFPEDTDELVDILDSYGCRKVPTDANLQNILQELGHKELVQKPKYIAVKMREICHTLQGSISRERLNGIYKELQPTPKGIIDKIIFPVVISARQQETASMLKRYIRSLDDATLKKLLRFCTGSDVLSMPEINVDFNSEEGLACAPFGRTCTNTLTVPETYESYVEFKKAFNELLNSGVWVMDVI